MATLGFRSECEWGTEVTLNPDLWVVQVQCLGWDGDTEMELSALPSSDLAKSVLTALGYGDLSVRKPWKKWTPVALSRLTVEQQYLWELMHDNPTFVREISHQIISPVIAKVLRENPLQYQNFASRVVILPGDGTTTKKKKKVAMTAAATATTEEEELVVKKPPAPSSKLPWTFQPKSSEEMKSEFAPSAAAAAGRVVGARR